MRALRGLLTVVALVLVSTTAAVAQAPTTAPPTTLLPATTAAPTTTIAGASEGQAPPQPVLVVEPDTGLLDGQVVALSGTGWGPIVGPYLCGELADIGNDCIAVGQADTDRNGNLSGSAALPARFTTPTGTAVDCRMEQCEVALYNYRGDGDGVPVTFAELIAATPGFTG